MGGLLTEICQRAKAGPSLTLAGLLFRTGSFLPLCPLASEIIKLIPELVRSLLDLQPNPALDPEAEKRRLFEALTQFFIRLAAAQPLLLILEDLYWNDETSLGFVQLFASITDHSVLLIASYRREEKPPRLIHLLAQLDRAHLAREITFDPLQACCFG